MSNPRIGILLVLGSDEQGRDLDHYHHLKSLLVSNMSMSKYSETLNVLLTTTLSALISFRDIRNGRASCNGPANSVAIQWVNTVQILSEIDYLRYTPLTHWE